MAGIEGLNSRFVTAVSLEEYFVDKDTGLPLAGGSLEFWKDIDRNSPKLVYQLTGSPDSMGGYSYAPMSNPVTLSGVGTVESGGDNVALYYFPFQGTPDASDGSIELYYVVVKDSLGVIQFTREAWPSSVLADEEDDSPGIQSNQISNGQFVDFDLFNDTEASFIRYSGTGSKTVDICADWYISLEYTGTGQLTVGRVPISGSVNNETNPPYWLEITPGANSASITLVQKFNHNPGIWAKTNDGITSYVSAGILLDNGTSAVVILAPSVGTPTQLLNQNNASGSPKYYTSTTAIDLSTNSQNADNGYTALIISLSPTGASRISSIQITSSASDRGNVGYVQDTVNRQQDYTYHYYKDALAAKAIPSFLVGWDFPLNPAQLGGSTQSVSGALNTSKYVWDQTILFQSAASGFEVTRTTTLGSLQVQCKVAGAQFALVQYLEQDRARALLRNILSSQVNACTNQANGLFTTVSLWYTTSANLPVIGSNNSIVLTLDAYGKPDTFNQGTPSGSWFEIVPKDSLPQGGTIPFGSDNDGAPLNFSYWDAALGSDAANTATFFAIVVGTAPMTLNSVVQFRSISLVPGKIATIPAPQARDEVLRECRWYYSKSYAPATSPGAAGVAIGVRTALQLAQNGNTGGITSSFSLQLESIIRNNTNTTIYAYTTGTAGNVTFFTQTNTPTVTNQGNAPIATWNFANSGTLNTQNCTYFISATLGYLTAGTVNAYILYHYVTDARLGVI